MGTNEIYTTSPHGDSGNGESRGRYFILGGELPRWVNTLLLRLLAVNHDLRTHFDGDFENFTKSAELDSAMECPISTHKTAAQPPAPWRAAVWIKRLLKYSRRMPAHRRFC